MTRSRALFKYYGGKALLSPWIVEHLPPHQCYVEPFCGAANVLFAKERSKIEVVNDLDRGVVSALQACRDHPEELAHLLSLTPYSRTEFVEAIKACRGGYSEDLLESARLFLVLMMQGRNGCTEQFPGNWSHTRPVNGNCGAEGTWARLPERVWKVTERLQGVVVECFPAEAVIRFYDQPGTLFYVDPPYHPRTAETKWYKHRLTVAAHEALAAQLHGLQGMVVLSGYRHADYDRWYEGWERVDRGQITTASCGDMRGRGAPAKRVESLWFNPLAWERLRAAQEATR